MKETSFMKWTDRKEEKAQNEKWKRLYLSYRQRLYYVALSILKDSADAEDVLQDAFLRIRNHLDKINEEDSHKTMAFLVITVKHIAIDYLRKRKRATIVSLDKIENQLMSEEVDAGIGNSGFEEAFRRLSFDYAEILRLKYDQCFTNAEISEFLDLTEGAVRKRLSRARKKLEVLMHREDEK